jgi:hypothetical protein
MEKSNFPMFLFIVALLLILWSAGGCATDEALNIKWGRLRHISVPAKNADVECALQKTQYPGTSCARSGGS